MQTKIMEFKSPSPETFAQTLHRYFERANKTQKQDCNALMLLSVRIMRKNVS